MNIKEIVFKHINSLNGIVNVQELSREILTAFPNSKWGNTHWSFYKSQITSENGRYYCFFSDEVKNNLRTIASEKINEHSYPKVRASGATRLKTSWPDWQLPSEDEQLKLAKVLLPHIKILDPRIVALVACDNNRNLSLWQNQLERLKIRSDIYLWENSPVSFPGVRRHTGNEERSTYRNNRKDSRGENALFLDANSFPKEIWSFALRNNKYDNTNPPHYSLAHILDHQDYKTRNVQELNWFEGSDDKNIFAGLFTSCANTIYIPLVFLKPTDHNNRIRQLLIQIVDKYYGSVCNVLPRNLSFNVDGIEDDWRLDNFSPPTVVGNVDNTYNFLAYRNNLINRRLEELLKAQ